MGNKKIRTEELNEIAGGEVRYEQDKVTHKWIVLVGNKPFCMFSSEDEARKFVEGPAKFFNSNEKPKNKTWSEWFWSFFGY